MLGTIAGVTLVVCVTEQLCRTRNSCVVIVFVLDMCLAPQIHLDVAMIPGVFRSVHMRYCAFDCFLVPRESVVSHCNGVRDGFARRGLGQVEFVVSSIGNTSHVGVSHTCLGQG